MSHHDVFISHSAKDKPVADAICAALEKEGVRCWIAPRDILPGQTWGGAIIDAIGGSRAFVLVFSSNANESQQVVREVERAVNKIIPIIPFKIDEVTPSKDLEFYIMTQHWLDAMTPPLEAHIKTLCTTIKRLLDVEDKRETEAEPPADESTIVISDEPPPPDKALFEIKTPEKTKGFPVFKAAAILGVLLILVGVLFIGFSGERKSDVAGGDYIDNPNITNEDPGTGGEEPYEFVSETLPPPTPEPAKPLLDDLIIDDVVVESAKIPCTGNADPDSTSGYQGDPLTVTLVLDPPIAYEIQRVEVASGCTDCLVTNLGLGLWETNVEWWGEGPVTFSFTAYDSEGDARCTIFAPAMEALGVRDEITFESLSLDCGATTSAFPETAYIGDEIELNLTLGESFIDRAGNVFISAPTCENCAAVKGLIPGTYYLNFEMPWEAGGAAKASYTVYDKSGDFLCSGDWDTIVSRGFRDLELPAE